MHNIWSSKRNQLSYAYVYNFILFIGQFTNYKKKLLVGISSKLKMCCVQITGMLFAFSSVPCT